MLLKCDAGYPLRGEQAPLFCGRTEALNIPSAHSISPLFFNRFFIDTFIYKHFSRPFLVQITRFKQQFAQHNSLRQEGIELAVVE